MIRKELGNCDRLTLALKDFRGRLAILVLLSSIVYAASVKDQPECEELKVEPGSPLGYFHFENIARKITVRGCIETPNGRKIGARFILDTGAEQTSLNPTLVEYAKLKPSESKQGLLTTNGVRWVPQVELVALMLNGRQIRPLTANVDESLVHASQQFSYNFGGVVGLDVLSHYVVSIDYPYRRVAFLEKPARTNRSSEVARFNFEVRHGQMVVNSILPNGHNLLLEFDTGFGLDADVMLYEDAVQAVELQSPVYSVPMEDGVEVRVGHIPWINFENIHVESPTVALNQSKVPNVFGERYIPGLLGPVLFENYTVEIDFHNHVVRVLRTKPRFQVQVRSRTGGSQAVPRETPIPPR